MGEPLAILENVSRTYPYPGGDRTSLREVSAVLNAGARVAVVGPSGSGKTTLLHLLGGLDEPSVGKVSWPALGRRDQLRPLKVGIVFQGSSLLLPLTVRENVALPLLLGGVGEAEALDRASSTLDDLGLIDFASRLPEELSGGQAQRVVIARALVARPQLVLADEPTGQLDHATAASLLDAIFAMLSPESCLVIATHDVMVAEAMRSKWRLHDGCLVSGT